MTTTLKKPRPRREPTARSLMQRNIVTVSRTAPLSEVENLLTEHRISGMPVVDAAGRAIGVVSYRDLLDHYAENPDARPSRSPGFFRLSTEHLLDEDFESFEVPPESEDTVADVMTPDVISVRADATMREVAQTMVKRDVHRVLVTDPKSERVVGILSAKGLLSAVAR